MAKNLIPPMRAIPQAAIALGARRIADRPAMAQAYAELAAQRFLASLQPPFASVSNYLYAVNRARELRNWRPDNAIVRADQLRVTVQTQVGIQMDDVWNETRFNATAQRALAMGAAVAGGAIALGVTIGTTVGTAAGAGFAGIGAVVGAAVGCVVGLVVGCICALIPMREIALFDSWREVVKALTIEERFACYGAFRDLSNKAREMDKLPAFPAFRLIDSPLFSIRAGMANTTYILFQALWEKDSWPVGDNLRTVHALATAAAELNDDQWLSDSHEFGKIMAGEGSQWLRPHFDSQRRTTAGNLRATARALGITDIGREPTAGPPIPRN